MLTTHTGMAAGLSFIPVSLEATATRGLPKLVVTGSKGRSPIEVRERLITILRRNALHLKKRRTVLSHSSQDWFQVEPHFELAQVVSLMKLMGAVSQQEEYVWLGSVSLEGSVQKVHNLGTLLYGLHKAGFKKAIIPESQKELAACFAKKIELKSIRSIAQLTAVGNPNRLPTILYHDNHSKISAPNWRSSPGHSISKKILLYTLAGSHHTLLVGPPGSGKTRLARSCAMAALPLTTNQRMEQLAIRGTAESIEKRPFEEVSSITNFTDIFGKNQHWQSGAVNTSSSGFLLFDELFSASSKTLEGLKLALSNKTTQLSFKNRTEALPANFTLLATGNPCPCGFSGSVVKNCSCPAHLTKKYLSKLNAAFRDRLVIWHQVETETDPSNSEELATFSSRFPKVVEKLQNNPLLPFSAAAKACLSTAVATYKISHRQQKNLHALASTIATFHLAEEISETHLLEALSLRPPPLEH